MDKSSSTSPSKRKPKFDAHAEALKFLRESAEAEAKIVIIDSETIHKEGGKVKVRLSDGTLTKPFFYNEKRQQWMELPF